MTITRPATAPPHVHQVLKTLHRWANALAPATPRTRRARRRTTLAHPPGPPLSVWALDPTELTTALERSRW